MTRLRGARFMILSGGVLSDDTSESEDDGSESDQGSDDQRNNGEENTTNPTNEPEHIQFIVRQFVNRVRNYIDFILNIRAINGYVKAEARLYSPLIKAGLLKDFIVRWNTTFIMLDRFKNHRTILNNINSHPFKV